MGTNFSPGSGIWYNWVKLDILEKKKFKNFDSELANQ